MADQDCMTTNAGDSEDAFSAPPRRAGLRFRIMLGIGILLVIGVIVQLVFNPDVWRDLNEGYHIAIGKTIKTGMIDRVVVHSRDGHTYLWAGERVSQRFDISEFQLEPESLHYGLGREYFYAPTLPQFISRSDADAWLHDATPVLAVEIENEIKVYPIPIVRQHEVVNDVVGGRPVFAAYCVLADLGAVYDRRYGEETLSFAVSGYTYYDPAVWDGLDAFVLWDRDTESLWWPPIGKAVSGPLIDTPMQVLDEGLWSQSTYGKIKSKYTDRDFLVLDRVQNYVPPKVAKRPLLRTADLVLDKALGGETHSIAPRWGENSDADQ